MLKVLGLTRISLRNRRCARFVSDSGHFSRNGFLTRRGLRLVAQRSSLEGLLPRGATDRVDKSGSVSALVEVEEDFDYDPNHSELNRRLIHNG